MGPILEIVPDDGEGPKEAVIEVTEAADTPTVRERFAKAAEPYWESVRERHENPKARLTGLVDFFSLFTLFRVVAGHGIRELRSELGKSKKHISDNPSKYRKMTLAGRIRAGIIAVALVVAASVPLSTILRGRENSPETEPSPEQPDLDSPPQTDGDGTLFQSGEDGQVVTYWVTDDSGQVFHCHPLSGGGYALGPAGDLPPGATLASVGECGSPPATTPNEADSFEFAPEMETYTVIGDDGIERTYHALLEDVVLGDGTVLPAGTVLGHREQAPALEVEVLPGGVSTVPPPPAVAEPDLGSFPTTSTRPESSSSVFSTSGPSSSLPSTPAPSGAPPLVPAPAPNDLTTLTTRRPADSTTTPG